MHTLTRGDTVKKRTKYMITGLLAGVANGFFGAGGGLFLVPLFVGWVGLEQRKAFATSVAVVLPLCVAALVSYVRKGGVDLATALPYLAGVLMLYGGLRAVLLL